MRWALIVSIGFHVMLLIAGMVGLPYLKREPPPIEQPISVEIVETDDLTTTDRPPVEAPPRKEPPPEKAAPVNKKPENRQTVDLKEPPKSASSNAPPKPAVVKKPEPKVPPPPEEQLEKPPPEKKPPPEEPDKQEDVQQEDSFSKLVRDLTEAEPVTEPQQPDPQAPPAPAQFSPQAPIAPKITENELAALSRQMHKCWSIPIGAEGAHDAVVHMRVWANPDRTIRKVEYEEILRVQADPAFRAMAESARRALLDPRCSPLDLPPEKHEIWRDKYIVIPFDPRALL